MKKVFLYTSIMITVMILITGCSNKTSFASRTYHDITHRYNYYFNARYIYQQSLKQINQSQQEDYNELLPLTTASPTSGGSSPDLDKVIKKSSVGIQIHDNSKWVDDSYLLIGKANFAKGNYEEALQAFQHITSEFETGIRKKETKKKASKRRTKQRRSDDNIYYSGFLSFMKHKPARYEAIIWIVKSYSALNKFIEAQSVIELARADKQFPVELMDDLELAVTQMYLTQNDYINAANALTKAISLTEKKKDRRRFHYILAQLHQRNGSYKNAIDNYNEVLSLQPNYQMEFYSKINIARVSLLQENSNPRQIVAQLNDLLRNEKYKEFKGEIYFTLAQIYEKENDLDRAIENYDLAVQHSFLENQKAAAYLSMADIYFGRESYVTAKAYYDSTLLTLSNTHPEYDDITSRSNILQNLVEQINIIEEQDSLQALAQMSDTDLQAFLQQQRDERARTTQINEAREISLLDDQQVKLTATSWPFDNPSQRGSGFSEFRMIYGNRPLEDNWRRSDKSSMADIDPALISEDGAAALGENITVEEFRATLPVTEEQVLASNNQIITAYYKLGNIYKDELNNEAKAATTFETLLNRFPQNRFKVQTLYQLYLFNKDSNPSMAENYKRILMNEYPDHILTKVLENPNYVAASQQKETELSQFYAATFDHFESNNYEQVLRRKKLADSLYTESHLKPQFDMLEALTFGKQGKMDTFRTALENIVNKYPLHDVKTQALAILNAMEGNEYRSNTAPGENKKYLAAPGAPHYIMIIFKEVKPINTEIQNELARYVDKNFSRDNLKVNTLMLDTETQSLVVKEFPNSAKAMAFYNEVRYKPEIFKGLDRENYSIFAITVHNHGVFFREKDAAEYLQFFSEQYLNKK